VGNTLLLISPSRKLPS